MQTEADLGFNISGGEGAGEGRGILVDHMGIHGFCFIVVITCILVCHNFLFVVDQANHIINYHICS